MHFGANRQQPIGIFVEFKPVAAAPAATLCVDLANDAFGKKSRIAGLKARDPIDRRPLRTLAPPPQKLPQTQYSPACSSLGR